MLTLANDCVGDRAAAADAHPTTTRPTGIVEQEFMLWSDAVNLARKAPHHADGPRRVGRGVCDVGGQSEGRFAGEAGPAADRGRSGGHAGLDPAISTATSAVDGIVFDACGQSAEYHLLKSHPGDGLASGLPSITTASGGLDDPLFPHRSARAEPGDSRDHARLAAFRAVAALHLGGACRRGNGGGFRGGALHRRPGQRRGGPRRADGPGGTGTPAWPRCFPADGELGQIQSRAAGHGLCRIQEGNPQ